MTTERTVRVIDLGLDSALGLSTALVGANIRALLGGRQEK